MNILVNSKDLVNLALTIGILGISWALVYFLITITNVIREIRQILDELRQQLVSINQIIVSTKSKVSEFFSYWSVLEKLLSNIVGLLQNSLVDRFRKKTSSSETEPEEPVLDNYKKTTRGRVKKTK